MSASERFHRNYVTKHEQIANKLEELTRKCDCACLPVSKIATELGIGERTVRAHLKIMQMHGIGVFNDPREKEFCTKEGIVMLARKLGLKVLKDQGD